MNASSLESTADSEWLRRYALHGEMDAFEALAVRYRSMVLATCRRVLQDEADVEDAAQETFLKLARGAGRIRGNVAAWLHAAARGTAIDMVRRRGLLSRAERSASQPETEQIAQSDNTDLRWSDLELVVDEALTSLSESDRGLIVARYLAERSVASLASEEGVSPGTMSRRLDRSMRRLRRELVRRGVREGRLGGGSAALGVVLLGASAGAACSDACAAGIAKAGLSGIARGAGTASGSLVGSKAGIAMVGTALVVVVGGVAMLTAPSGNSSTGNLVAGAGTTGEQEIVTQPDLGPARVRGTLGPFEIVTVTDPDFAERAVWFGDERVSIAHGVNAEGELKRAVLRIVETVELDDPVDMRAEGIEMRLRLENLSPIDDPYSRFTEIRDMRVRAFVDEIGRLVIEPLTEGLQLGRNEPNWYGVRPPLGFAESSRIPENAGPHGLLGPWGEAERIPVTINSREIRFGTELWQQAIYRVIEWERLEGYSRILSVHAGGRDPRQIGTRFRLIIKSNPRSQGGGYTVAFYPPGSGMGDAWPSSFEPGPGNPVRVVTFTDDI